MLAGRISRRAAWNALVSSGVPIETRSQLESEGNFRPTRILRSRNFSMTVPTSFPTSTMTKLVSDGITRRPSARSTPTSHRLVSFRSYRCLPTRPESARHSRPVERTAAFVLFHAANLTISAIFGSEFLTYWWA